MASSKESQSFRPSFTRFSNGELKLNYSDEAKKFKDSRTTAEFGESSISARCLEDGVVKNEARMRVVAKGGDASDELNVLGQYKLQFGLFKGQTFKWLLENGLGYAAWLVDNMRHETATTAPLSKNKHAFKKYVNSFVEGRSVVDMKARERIKKSSSTDTSSQKSSHISLSTHSPAAVAAKLKRRFSHVDIQPRIPKAKTTQDPSSQHEIEVPTGDIPHDVLLSTVTQAEAQELRKQSEVKCPHPSGVNLIDGWKETLPTVDHQWVSQAFFRISSAGKPVFDNSRVRQLWYYPPQPSLVLSQPPRVAKYFVHRLFLWLPRKLWRVKFLCPHSDCDKTQLTSAGIYPRVRLVLDVDEYYIMASEYLECSTCKRKVIGWSPSIVSQLDIAHQLQFPILLTYRYACDMKVVRLLRQRGLGNSSSQLQKKLSEQHNEAWLAKCALYLSDWQSFVNASKKQVVVLPVIEEPPSQHPVPGANWLLTAYCHDVMKRVDDVKASITSTFGSVLKIDSTKKVVKKLAGNSAGTAAWATNVGNEFGQVLISVLTSSEGCGLKDMAAGLANRYRVAGVSPPGLLYTDRDCCGASGVKAMFPTWNDLCVRLDVWHFMRRIAIGCTTESHPLYKVFMSRLSQCIFEWSEEDVANLRKAKACELVANRGSADPEYVSKTISKKELALHCRRRTRGTETTTALIYDLLETFTGEQGRDTLGVPLLDEDRIWDIWKSQMRHVACIQDPDDIQLYIQTGTIVKGGVTLPTLRCARGSTSLESFHLHLNRFIPGTSANDVHFQAYLLDGLVRWNKDRESAALGSSVSTYSSLTNVAINDLSAQILGKNLVDNFVIPNEYTGELIGIEYLYAQTGKVLQQLDPETETVEDNEDDEGFHEIETVEDLTMSHLNSSIDKLQETDDTKETATGEVLQSMEEEIHTIEEDITEPEACESSKNSNAEEEESVGPDGVEGYGKVMALADFLANLEPLRGSLSKTQAEQLIALWDDLSPFDKRPVTFSPRHKDKLTTGRFKVTKKASVPGVDSTRRCFLGQNSGPAQWPDSNRYMEALVVKLCARYPDPKRDQGRTILRWTQVLQAYKKIREMVLSNSTVMSRTSIQLVEINNATLTKWYNKRSKNQERQVLEQGISLPQPPPTTPQALPTARPLSSKSLPEVRNPNPHRFYLPPNTAGQANVKIVPSAPMQNVPHLLPNLPYMLPTPVPFITTPLTQPTTSANIPASTVSYRKRKQERQLMGEVKKTYRARTGPSKCSKCGEPRVGEHRQYFGNWYCPTKSEQTFDQWRLQFAEKQYKKKKD